MDVKSKILKVLLLCKRHKNGTRLIYTYITFVGLKLYITVPWVCSMSVVNQFRLKERGALSLNH